MIEKQKNINQNSGADRSDVTIEVKDVSKIFRVYGDKSHTFKDRILFAKRNKYEEHRVLDHISFDVHRGQALGLIGHNGCGKSTTLKLLNKIIYPDGGSIVMHGKISSLIELGAGFHPDMSGRENIYINASIFGLKKKEIDRRLDDIIRFSELEQFIDNPVRTYSSGMYMRLAFSIAINVDADILLVDEILAVGDANFQKKCFDKLQEIKANGATIVIVSHNMDQVKSFCDSVAWIDAGHLREYGESEDVCNRYLAEMSDLAEERAREELREQGIEVQEDPNKAYPIKDICSQFGIFSRRFGNMKMRFTHIELLNDKNECSQQFRYGDKVIVRFDVERFNLEVEAPLIFVINIFHADGRFCSHFTTEKSKIELKADGVTHAEFVIEHLNLASGRYILDAVLAPSDSPEDEAYDCLAHLVEFDVDTQENRGSEIAAMDNDWMISKEVFK